MNAMSYKKWIIITLLLSLVLPGIVAGINYFMDPLWCFSLSHRYNMKQDDFNERQQKTNYITYHDFNYRGIIIGASTSTNINQHSFKGLSVYNYAINGLNPVEYLPYLRYAKERNGRDFDFIFLGLDFLLAAKLDPPLFDAEKIFADTNGWLYRVKTLVSIDTLKFSRRNFMNYLYGRHIYYDRNNVKYTTSISRESLEINMKYLLEHFNKSSARYSFNNYTYNPEYRAVLQKIKDENPRSRCVVYTTPVITPLMVAIVRNNLLDEYLLWLKDIVEVYGECYHFMYPNAINDDYMKNYHDPNHYYPFVCDMMVNAMYNDRISGDTAFGMYINRSNLADKLAQLERLMKQAARRR